MRYVFILIINTLIGSSCMFAQFEDAVWMTGYSVTGQPSPPHGYNKFSFLRNNEIQIDTGSFKFSVGANNLSYSDEDGLRMFTNGCRVMDGATRQNAVNGSLINYPGFTFELTCEPSSEGYAGWQMSLALPHPNKIDHITMFHLSYTVDTFTLYPDALLRTEINLNGEEGNVEVIEKNIPVLSDHEYYFSNGLNATRHANGRDWWVIVNKIEKEVIETYFWDGEELTLTSELYYELPDYEVIPPSIGQSTFSPDGSIYVTSITEKLGKVYINQFDRCSGEMSLLTSLDFRKDIGGCGVSISANGRFLYVTHKIDVWQFDLTEDDIKGSRKLVGIFDPDIEQVDNLEKYTNLWWAQRAPNGKIYISSTNSQSHFHVIHYPDLEGEESGYEQFGFRFVKRRGINGMPLYPNYHVTAMPGTPCDTLDMGKAPYTKWNYQVRGDTVRFFDLSYYSPTEWSWDFGDGQTGEGAMPIHVYEEKGIYQVCLTASSAYGSDEFCMEVESGTTSVKEEISGVRKLEIYPNPVQKEVYISQDMLGSSYEIVSMSGQRVGIGVLESERLDVRALQGGVYMLRVWVEGEVCVGKVIKI